MTDPWGVDQPAANADDPQRDAEVVAGGEEDDLPEVQRLTAEGWELLDDAPVFALLPAAWPPMYRTWVPDRLARYETHVDRRGQTVENRLIAPDDTTDFEYEDDVERYAILAGLPPMPRNRIWLVKSPWPGVTVEEIYEAVQAVAEIGEAHRSDDTFGAVYRAMLVVREWSSEQVRAAIRPTPPWTHAVSDDTDLSALRADLAQLMEDHADEIEQRWLDLEAQGGADLFLTAPLRFMPLERDTHYRGRPLHIDNVPALEVRAYRRLV